MGGGFAGCVQASESSGGSSLDDGDFAGELTPHVRLLDESLSSNDIITAWVQLSPLHEKPNGYNFARDKVNIEGNQLITEFTQTGGTCQIDAPHNSDIAWSGSIKIRQHQHTMQWLTKCLRAAPANLHNGHSDSDASDSGDASDAENTDDVWVSGRLRSRTFKHRLVHRIRNTIGFSPGINITSKAIWLEGTATMRHIRLALEDNCSSCIRHPNLTIDGGSHSFTPAMQTNFDECCL